MDKQKLIAEIVQRFGIKLDKDDPAFILVELNQLVLEEAANKVTNQMMQAADKLNTVNTRSMDDFINVANESFSKLAHKTNELKVAIGTLQAPSSLVQTKLEPPLIINKHKWLWWILPSVFVIGVMIGATLAFFAEK